MSGNIVSQLVGLNLLSYFSALGGTLAIVSTALNVKKLDPIDLLIFFQILLFVAVTSVVNGMPILVIETVLSSPFVFVGQILNKEQIWESYGLADPFCYFSSVCVINVECF